MSPTTRDAAALRQLANRYRETDRGFAADLLSAADRHEESAPREPAGQRRRRRTDASSGTLIGFRFTLGG